MKKWDKVKFLLYGIWFCIKCLPIIIFDDTGNRFEKQFKSLQNYEKKLRQ